MLDQVFVFTILGAGLTGAGLTLAVYALILPIMRHILEYRANEYAEEVEEAQDTVKQLGTGKEDAETLSKLSNKVSQIESMIGIPDYLKWGAGIAFFLFTLTAMMSVAWYTGWEKATMDSWLPLVFQSSLFFFMGVGLLAIKDLTSSFQNEYDEIKQEISNKKLKTITFGDVEKELKTRTRK